MEKYQNVTISFARDTLKRAKVIAATKNTSVSAIVRGLLEDYVNADDAYERAQESAFAMLKDGLDMGTEGKVPWKRGDLHERR